MSFFERLRNVRSALVQGSANLLQGSVSLARRVLPTALTNFMFGEPPTPTLESQITSFVNSGQSGANVFDIEIRSNDLQDITDQIVEIISSINPVPGYIITLIVNNTGYAITNLNKYHLIRAIRGFVQENEPLTGSDRLIISNIRTIQSLRVKVEKIEINGNLNLFGGYFKYLHRLGDHVDLSRYGIFSQFDPENYQINCLVRAFQSSGMFNPSELNLIKTFSTKRIMPIKYFKEIAKEMKVKIRLRHLRKDGKTRVRSYGSNCDRMIKIGLLDEHYFLIDKKTKIKMSDLSEYHQHDQKKVYNSDGMNSFLLIKLLLKMKDDYLTPISFEQSEKTQYYSLNDVDFKNLDYPHDECARLYEIKSSPIDYDQYNVEYFDFETTTDGDKHVPYLCCSDGKSFTGTNCGKKLLESLNGDTILIAHNLGYDLKFLMKYLIGVNTIDRSRSSTINASGLYYSYRLGKMIKIRFKDSKAMINLPLSKFGETFSLKVEKQAMPYGIYTRESVNKSELEIKSARPHLSDEEWKMFLANIKKWNLITREGYFDHIGYSQAYCLMDCEVLKQGYSKFREWIKEIANIDILSMVSLASLADRVLYNRGCYEDVYELSGVPRAFIQKCIVGGRTMCNSNKRYHLKQALQDFDGVSLYPSAMYRLPGYLRGLPKVIRCKEIQPHWDGYFVQINITKIGKHRKFPLMSSLDKDGVRQFENKTGVYYVDKTTLEDWIKFQEIEYELIRGYYFDEGRNKKINDAMKYLFYQRVKMKKVKNPIQMVYKELMNSGYGKTIMKPIETKTVYVDDFHKFHKYYHRNHNFVLSYEKLHDCDKHRIKVQNPINNFYSRPHVGVEVLSMSKRIMNEVMCLAEDLGIDIYYQDTDSMHITSDSVKLLADKFRSIYGRELIGKDLGQFHNDFDFESDEEVVAVESIFLGKKCYIDKVRLVVEGIIKYDYHMRMKGIPESTLKYEIKRQFNDDPMALYKHLFDGGEVSFDLLEGGKKVRFEAGFNCMISSRLTFNRTLSFRDEE